MTDQPHTDALFRTLIATAVGGIIEGGGVNSPKGSSVYCSTCAPPRLRVAMVHSPAKVRLENPRPSIVHVVDDDGAVRDSTRALLESYAFEVRDYASAKDFLVRTPVTAGGCMLLDLHMPGMTGLELLDVLCERGCALPVTRSRGEATRRSRSVLSVQAR